MANASARFRTAAAAPSSPQRWREACANRPEIDVLMALKTGSEFLITSMKAHARRIRTRHKVPRSSTLLCGVTADPCERLHSTFAHLINKYQQQQLSLVGSRARRTGSTTCSRSRVACGARSLGYDPSPRYPRYAYEAAQRLHFAGSCSTSGGQPLVCHVSTPQRRRSGADDGTARTHAALLAGANKTRIPRVSRDPTTQCLNKAEQRCAQYDAVARFGTLSAGGSSKSCTGRMSVLRAARRDVSR